jgi:hypothetical protein
VCKDICVRCCCDAHVYPILARYPTGMDTGIKFYPRVSSWAGIILVLPMGIVAGGYFLYLSGTIIRGTLKAPNSQLVTPISIKLQRPDGCD